MEKRFLPVGSIVKLKGGERELMITSYCISPTGDVIVGGEKREVEENTIYDYGACLYPEGIVDSSMIFSFNSSDIAEIVFKGYYTEEYKEYVDGIMDALVRYKEKLENNN